MQVDYDIKLDENSNKDLFIVLMKMDVVDILNKYLKYPEHVIFNFSLHFPKKIMKKINLETKYKLFCYSYLIFPLFPSIQKEKIFL
jgi:hypothetical protein